MYDREGKALRVVIVVLLKSSEEEYLTKCMLLIMLHATHYARGSSDHDQDTQHQRSHHSESHLQTSGTA